jgi:hypothetical protein
MTSKTRFSFVIVNERVFFTSDEALTFLGYWAPLAHLVEEKMHLKEDEYLHWGLSVRVKNANASCLFANVGYHQGKEIVGVIPDIPISERDVSPEKINNYANQIVAALRGQREFQPSGEGAGRSRG